MLMKKYKKQLFTAILIVFLFFLISFFVGYCFFGNDDSSMEIKYKDSEIIRLTDVLPISDKLGKEYSGSDKTPDVVGYSELFLNNISSKTVSYEIYLTKIENSDSKISTIKGDYVKVYLTNNNDVPFSGYDSRKIPSFHDLAVLDDIPGGKLLYRGKLKAKEQEIFKIRMWISDSYAISSKKEKKESLYKVNIRSF